MIVSVVAGGWSVVGDGWPLDRLPGTVIGVNDAGLLLPRCDEVVSMDRLWAEGRWTAMTLKQSPAFVRHAALKRIERPLPNWLTPFECNNESVEMSDDPAVLNGTNSGGCAVNRAWQHRPTEVYLFGFDMQAGPRGEAHWYPQYEWKPKVKPRKVDWAQQFVRIAEQFSARGIKVWNASSRSLITAFPRVTPKTLRL